MAAYKTALAQGIGPETFWALTPYQTQLAIQGQRERQITLAWYIAALSRQKKLLELDALLGKKKNMQGLKMALQGIGAKGK